MSKRQLVVSSLVVAAAAALAVPRLTFDRAAWCADLDALEAHLARAYANLDDAPRRGLDLAALDRRTREALAVAATDREARAALASFLAAFRDPHLAVRREKLSKRLERWWRELGRREGAPARLDAAASAAEACAAIGAGSPRQPELGFGLAGLPGFAPLPAGDLAAGTLELGGRRLGFVRLPSFEARHHPAACAAAWEALRARLPGPCDEACQEELAGTALEDAVLGALAARVRELRDAGATALVVDVSGNGGGSGWADAAARGVTARAPDCPGGGFVRHPHHLERLDLQVRELEGEARRADLTPGERALVERARARTAELLAGASVPCDASGVWRGEAPACSNRFVPGGRACGLLGPLPREAVREPEAWGVLDPLWQWRYQAGAWSGPLAVLVDGRTASASEAFAATLRDGDAARLIGARTLGAGCGYTNGGIPLRLPHSGLEVRAPDCSRLRRDGTNELDGLAPDFPASGPGDLPAALAAWARSPAGAEHPGAASPPPP